MPDLEDVYDEAEEQAALARVLLPRWERTLLVVHRLVQTAFPELPEQRFRLDDAATRSLLAKAAARVVMIDEHTRTELRRVLQLGQQRGYSDQQIADGVPAEDYGGVKGLYLETWKSRATTIARTELSMAQVEASLDRYAATGLVKRVQLVEHTDTDEECSERNGKVVPITTRPTLNHPNCRLSVIPVVDV